MNLEYSIKTNSVREMKISQRTTAIIAGSAYLLIFVLTPHSWIDPFVVASDPATTFINLSGSVALFRIAIACWLVVLVADTVVAWALYLFFVPVNSKLSLLASWFRLLFVAVFAVNMLNWLNILQLLEGSSLLEIYDQPQLEDEVLRYYEAYNYGTNISFIFFGIHIGLLGYLVLLSGYVPRFLGVLLMIAFAGYLIDSFGSVLSPKFAGSDIYFWIFVAVPAIIAEFSLTLWLLIKGGKSVS